MLSNVFIVNFELANMSWVDSTVVWWCEIFKTNEKCSIGVIAFIESIYEI